MIYRFVGSSSDIGNVKLDRFGQKLDVTSEFARQCQLGGAAIIPDSDFKKIGFTSEALRIWASPFMDHSTLPADPKDRKDMLNFLSKRREARQKFINIRKQLRNPPKPAAKEA